MQIVWLPKLARGSTGIQKHLKKGSTAAKADGFLVLAQEERLAHIYGISAYPAGRFMSGSKDTTSKT